MISAEEVVNGFIITTKQKNIANPIEIRGLTLSDASRVRLQSTAIVNRVEIRRAITTKTRLIIISPAPKLSRFNPNTSNKPLVLLPDNWVPTRIPRTYDKVDPRDATKPVMTLEITR